MYAGESLTICIPVSWITCNFTINLNSALRIDTVSLSQSNGRTEYPVCLGKGWYRQWGRKGVKDVQWIATNRGNDLVTRQGRALKGPSLFRHWKFSACTRPRKPGVQWVTILDSRNLSLFYLSVTLNRGLHFSVKSLPAPGPAGEHTNWELKEPGTCSSCHLSLRKGRFDSNIWWYLWENLGYFCNWTT